MSGLCPRPPDLATKIIALNHFFYPQSYPQERTSKTGPFSRHRLFYEAKSRGKMRPSCEMWITMTFEFVIRECQSCLFMMIDLAFECTAALVRAWLFRTCF